MPLTGWVVEPEVSYHPFWASLLQQLKVTVHLADRAQSVSRPLDQITWPPQQCVSSVLLPPGLASSQMHDKAMHSGSSLNFEPALSCFMIGHKLQPSTAQHSTAGMDRTLPVAQFASTGQEL